MVTPPGVSNSYSTWLRRIGVSQALQDRSFPYPANILPGAWSGKVPDSSFARIRSPMFRKVIGASVQSHPSSHVIGLTGLHGAWTWPEYATSQLGAAVASSGPTRGAHSH